MMYSQRNRTLSWWFHEVWSARPGMNALRNDNMCKKRFNLWASAILGIVPVYLLRGVCLDHLVDGLGSSLLVQIMCMLLGSASVWPVLSGESSDHAETLHQNLHVNPLPTHGSSSLKSWETSNRLAGRFKLELDDKSVHIEMHLDDCRSCHSCSCSTVNEQACYSDLARPLW